MLAGWRLHCLALVLQACPRNPNKLVASVAVAQFIQVSYHQLTASIFCTAEVLPFYLNDLNCLLVCCCCYLG